jgi:hypothetical protein
MLVTVKIRHGERRSRVAIQGGTSDRYAQLR